MQDIFDLKKFDVIMPEFKVNQSSSGDGDNNIDFITDDEFEIVNKVYYGLAAAIGLISGSLDILMGKEFSLANIQNLGDEEAEKIIIKKAKKYGNFDGDDLKAAQRNLEKFEWGGDKVRDDFGGAKKHHFRDFTHYASPIGLLFALIAQYSKNIKTREYDGKVYGILVDDLGVRTFTHRNMPKSMIGDTNFEKFRNATFIWVLHLASDLAGSSGCLSRGTGLPGNVVSALEVVAQILKKLGITNGDDVDRFAEKIFEGININGDKIKFDKRFELGLGKYIKSQVYPVMINELLTRSAFSVCKFVYEIKNKEIKNFNDIEKVDFKSLIPLNNQVLTRMFTISSGIFLLVNGTKAAVKGVMTGNISVVFANINYIGVGRFAIAIWYDKDYIICDIKKYLKYYKKRQLELKQLERKALSEFKYFALNEKETRLLNSVKVQKVLYDISCTKNEKDRIEKEKWLEKFKSTTKQELKTKNDYFITDANLLYKKTNKMLKKHLIHYFFNKGYDDRLVFSFIMQLIVFNEYYNFDVDDKFKVKYVTDYEKDYVVYIQKMLNYDDVQRIKKQYNKYKTIVSGSWLKLGTTIATVAITATLTGGAGLIFAPTIAVGLVGSAFALNGAALTSASLALIGGGSLAVGGFGIFGGTVVITGGGALIGLIGSGIASSSRLKVYINSQTIMHESAELLTYVKSVISKNPKDIKLLDTIQELYNEEISIIDEQLKYIKDHKEYKIDNKKINGIKESRNYIMNSVKEIHKICKEIEDEENKRIAKIVKAELRRIK